MSAIITQRKQILRPPYVAPSGAIPFFTNNFSSGDFSYNDSGNRWSNATGGMSISNLIGYAGSGFSACFDINNFAELRYEFASSHPEVWIVWIMWFPDGTESPSLGPRWERFNPGVFQNNKFLRLIGGTSSAEQLPRRGIETDAGTANGDEEISIEASLSSFSPGAIGGIPTSYNVGKNFPTDPNRGHWIALKFYAKKSTTGATTDGLEQFWVAGELWQTATPFAEQQGDAGGFGNGYFMGSINGSYPAGTKCYLGQANFYTTDPG